VGNAGEESVDAWNGTGIKEHLVKRGNFAGHNITWGEVVGDGIGTVSMNNACTRTAESLCEQWLLPSNPRQVQDCGVKLDEFHVTDIGTSVHGQSDSGTAGTRRCGGGGIELPNATRGN
jgi:hypothetical protein